MNKFGQIVIIEDDEDDREILREIFEDLLVSNEIAVFTSAEPALKYLRKRDVKPFLILSDINLPAIDGYALKKMIQDEPELNAKCIPFLFISTDASTKAVTQAYKLSVQGIFKKPVKYEDWKLIIHHIVLYWTDCMSPNRIEDQN